jgi:acetyl esterase/lipase
VNEKLVRFDDIVGRTSPPPDRRLAYGEEALQFGELRVPEGAGPHPVAIVIHGGCWRARYDIGHIESFSEALRENGIASWTLEYRRVGNPGGGWPGTFLDVAAGADALRSFGAEEGLDLARVVAVGHSAGGQLALWLAARGELSTDSPVRGGVDPLRLKGVLSLAGVDDLRRALIEGVCDDMAAQLLGGAPDEVGERYEEASPAGLLPLGIPIALVSGALDPIVPLGFGRELERKARALGDAITLNVVEDAGHFELIAPWSSAFEIVLRSLSKLLER